MSKSTNPKNSNLLQLVLEQLNLSELAIKVYQLLLHNPELNVSNLATKLGVYRLKVYNALEELQKAELIVQSEDYNRKIELEPPAKIITKLKLKENNLNRINSDFEEILPQLQSQYYSSTRLPITKIYEGKKQFLHIFHQILEESSKGDEILIVSEGEDFYDFIELDYILENFMKPRVKKGVYVKALIESNNKGFIGIRSNDERELRYTRIMPKSFQAFGSVWIAGNKVINWNTVMARAIVIEDKVMADFYRQMFQILWDSGEL
jgi:sugar-specific transcriptional regulator TrmB